MYQYITISNLEKMQLQNNLLDQFTYIKKKNNDFFLSNENVITDLKLLSKFLPYDLANQWLLFKQNQEANKFFTFNQWKRKGFKIKKGQKASYIIGYKEKTFIVNEEENKLTDWENADIKLKEKVIDGITSTVKKKVLSLVAVFGDNQIVEDNEQTKLSYTHQQLNDILLKYLKNFKFDINIEKTTKNEINIDLEAKKIDISYFDNYLTLNLLKALVNIILKLDNYQNIQENTELEENIISFLILESLKLNNYEYNFENINYILKTLNDIEKEKFLCYLIEVAKQIKNKF